jgi:hypothetical protein
MKIRKLIFRLSFILLAGSLFTYSCKKDSSNTNDNPLPAQQTIQVQNADAQDAVAEKTEEDVDNKLDELQNNNYAIETGKSLLIVPTNEVVITVDHPDTTIFPKVITFTYYNYKDSSANENIIKNGTITIKVTSAFPNNRKLISRSFVFDNFAVTTDSTTLILNGTRTVTRQKASIKFKGLQSVRISVSDIITDTLKFAVATTGSTDTLHFTRKADKVRTAITHFNNILYTPDNLLLIYFRHIASYDSLTYNGIVTGVNEEGKDYTKTITSPLVVTVYQGSLIISSGEMTYVVGSDSYNITFKADPDHKHLTLVTVTNNLTGKSLSFDRYFGRIFRRWW